MQTLSDYVRESAVTKIYDEKWGLAYEVLGLCAEVGETMELVNQAIGAGYEDLESDLVSELGGCLWYVARLCERFEIDIDAVLIVGGKFYDDRDLAITSGLLANKVKKILRDQDGKIAPSDALYKDCQSFLVLFMTQFKTYCHQMGIDVRQVAEYNLKQLLSRKRRGTLSGSGDDR